MQTATKEAKTNDGDQINKEIFPSHEFFFNLASGATLPIKKIKEVENNYINLLGEVSFLETQNDDLKEQLAKRQWQDIEEAPHDVYLAVGWFESNEKHPTEFKWVKGFFIKELSLEADYEEYEPGSDFIEETQESAYFKEGWYTFDDAYQEHIRPISPTHYMLIESPAKPEAVA